MGKLNQIDVVLIAILDKGDNTGVGVYFPTFLLNLNAVVVHIHIVDSLDNTTLALSSINIPFI